MKRKILNIKARMAVLPNIIKAQSYLVQRVVTMSNGRSKIIPLPSVKPTWALLPQLTHVDT